jgi:predicted metal-dependent hydrolase
MSTRKEEIKVKENIDVNKPTFYDENTAKVSTNTNNFNERSNNALNQQQDAINQTLDNTLNNVKRTTDEATREIPRYTQRIEAEKEAIGSFQSQVNRNSSGSVNSSSNELWDMYNPQRIAENHAVMVNNFTSYLLNTSNLINNALASNIRVYNTALEQTRDNLKAFAKTNTDCVKAVSGNSQSREVTSN